MDTNWCQCGSKSSFFNADPDPESQTNPDPCYPWDPNPDPEPNKKLKSNKKLKFYMKNILTVSVADPEDPYVLKVLNALKPNS
jgi:hypothetical protein